MSSNGFFSTMSSTGLGDPYEKKPLRRSPEKESRTFKVSSPSKLGKFSGNWGKQIVDSQSLFVGDPYVDPYKRNINSRRNRKFDRAFVPSSPSKIDCGSGQLFGSFTTSKDKQAKHLPDRVHKPVKKVDVENIKKNFYTHPSKKGSYGVFGTTFERITHKAGDRYDIKREMEKRELHQHRAKTANRRAFVSTASTVDFFDQKESRSVPVPSVYSMDESCIIKPPPLEELLPRKQWVTEQKEAELQRMKGGPFKCSSPPKTGMNGNFQSKIHYEPDLFDQKKVKAATTPSRLLPRQLQELADSLRPRTAVPGQRSSPEHGAAFKPSAVPKTTPFRSIVTANIMRNH
eukprot:TRINITY_DN777909_c0_g1_i1.p1 TRINITY_DN777909_c0_g1~~TRINITY_DN777909_c0_g1_i1.p1  ORF type:complete len:345 (-),score=83.96 TRINITY_DN777909_c0_g1_i1:362-1396(-)